MRQLKQLKALNALSLVVLFFCTKPSLAVADDYQQSYDLVLQEIKANHYPQAIDRLKEMAKDYPQDTQVKNNLAVLLTRQKQYEQAQQIFESILKGNPEYGVVFDNLNELYAFQAQKAYKQVFENTPLVLPKGNLLTLNKAPRDVETEVSRRVAFDQIEQGVRTALEAWRTAWQKQDIKAYVAAYEPDFRLDGDASHSEWLKNRKQSLQRPTRIQVDLTNVEILIVNENLVSASFTQAYKSNFYKDQIRKVLYFKLNNQRQWKIDKEVSIEVFD